MLSQQLASRRTMLNRIALGFGGLAFNALLPSDSLPAKTKPAGLAPVTPHFAPRAKSVVFLFMQGGVSHVDTFDPKPELDKYDGKEPPFQRARVKFAKRGNLLKSPWKFRPTGDSGLPMSSLWQHLPKVADELCMVHSVCDTNVAHGGATMKLFTGSDLSVRPSLGSWISYGLGTESADVPSYINICPSSLHGGVNNWGAAFLPSIHQGVPLGTPGYPNAPVTTAQFKYMNPSADKRLERLQLELMQKLAAEQSDTNAELNARLQSFELAFRMQMAAPKALDLSSESKTTQQLYGIGSKPTDDFGRQCLLARRLVERGVRFVQVNHAGSLRSQGIPTNEQWDQHSYLEKGHAVNAAQVDLPITGFLQDLKARGLLDETLVIWAGEFGRTPTSQAGGGKNIGRDHHTDGFTIWMAGGGVKGGIRYGATDEFGYYTIQDRMTLHDLHATILHLLGLDHTHLTWHYASRDFRLTDVYGNVAHDIIA
ncbi:MAG TPA: DUF1501 domain-containing protein [Pirellulaceae bacterium]|nr:DUF1501 domain-containing protein [Pirellulaceae bacterium]